MARPKLDIERREQILVAFETCVIELGLHKTTLQKVADTAGLPRPLVRHFVGNRDQIVTLLLERMVERAEANLAERFRQDPGLPELLDFLFDGAFIDPISNQLVDQLWQMAYHDDNVRLQLNSMYGVLKQKLIDQMLKSGLKNTDRCADAAQTLISLGFGETCFAEIGMATKSKKINRKVADLLIESLKEDE